MIVDETEAEGPGRRLALWLQGCPIRCPGCCNPEMFAEDRGTPMAIAEVVARVERAAARVRAIEGISILGGEPFAQAESAAEVARAARLRGLTVMTYSGYALAELHDQARTRPGITALLDQCDLLVDGRYDQTRPEPPPPSGRRWLGSTNQVMHYLTPAYASEDPRMQDANTLEIHWVDGRLVINGWPAGAAALANIRRSGGR